MENKRSGPEGMQGGGGEERGGAWVIYREGDGGDHLGRVTVWPRARGGR